MLSNKGLRKNNLTFKNVNHTFPVSIGERQLWAFFRSEYGPTPAPTPTAHHVLLQQLRSTTGVGMHVQT